MFLDTSVLWGDDLRTQTGKAYFYGYVRDFFSRIPRNQWALVSGKPIVFLYRTEGIAGLDQSSFDFVYQAFQQEFGVPLYIMRESSWDNPITGWSNISGPIRDYTRTLRTDGSYQWGSSGAGLLDVGDVANVGAGFDNTLVGGNLVVDRQDGNFFASNLYQAGHSGKRLTLLESWNEFHDGSGISETVEFGRKYIDIARTFADQFHALP